MADVGTLAQFYADLATKPYCTNSKGFSHIAHQVTRHKTRLHTTQSAEHVIDCT